MLFRVSKIRFIPTIVPTLAALCALCLTLYLGYWQQGRATEKAALQAIFEARSAAAPITLGAVTLDPHAMQFSRASVRGEWLASGQIFLDNKFESNAVGFHVITPLKIEGTSRYVLVNRGWIARGFSYPTPPSIPVPSGTVTVEGVLTLPSSRFLELVPETIQGNVWQNLTVERYRRASGHDVLPLVLLAKNSDAQLKSVSENPDARAEKHVEYMLTWYSLAATIVVLWVTLNIKREHESPCEPSISKGN